jgi:hypothetical protein
MHKGDVWKHPQILRILGKWGTGGRHTHTYNFKNKNKNDKSSKIKIHSMQIHQ